MDSIIYTYALAKTFRDKGEDLLDSFLPFVVQVLSEKPVAAYSVANKLKEHAKLDVPVHTLREILKRGEVKGYVTIAKRERYKITENGLDYKNDLEAQTSVERRINALLADIQEFYLSHHVSIDEESLKKLLDGFILKNIEALVQLYNRSKDESEDAFINDSSYDRLLIEYIIIANKSKPEHHNTLKDMLLGSIILVTIRSDKYKEFGNTGHKLFKDCAIYLDTNVIFSLFGCHGEESFFATSQLVRLIVEAGCSVKVFKFTIDEMVRYLQGYYEKDRNEDLLDRQDIYGRLASKSWKRTDIREFIAKIPGKLDELGIDLEETSDVDLEKYSVEKSDEYVGIQSYKPFDSKITLNHDLAAIGKIRQKREKPVYHIRNANAIFLTADKKLHDFNYSGMNHKSNGTIGEVMLDRLLTTIIWLNNPQIDVPLSAIISAHSKGIFTKWAIWDKFFTETENLLQKGQLSDEDILMLHYNSYIDDELKNYNEREIDKITPETIITLTEKARAKFEEEKQQAVNEQRQEIDQLFENARNRSAYIAQYVFLGIQVAPVLGFFGIISCLALVGCDIMTMAGVSTIASAAIVIINWTFGSYSQDIIPKRKERIALWIYTKWERWMK